ncbi:hypothetical protein M9Y10_015774 [Tritrichomonas musculus]|uniref:DUF3447 domain-containing protein n=1 Tax=Tritrichomonas musculus TaxID=1915356 RepID=A0ABR2I4M3_9EUKA
MNDYLTTMHNMQEAILSYLDGNEENGFEKVKNQINQQNINDKDHGLIEILHLLVSIANNHYRTPNFFTKIEQILLFYKEKLEIFPNYSLFNIFKSNKRLLLFLFNEKMITLDDNIINYVESLHEKNIFYHYFLPEIISFKNMKTDVKDIELFEDKRKTGENDSKICEIIRKDSIQEFVTYINQTNRSIKQPIKQSIFETNYLLTKWYLVGLIEYAAFFGSIKIFNYLCTKEQKLDKNLWVFAVHSNKVQMIHLLEEYDNRLNDDQELLNKCLNESFLCHHQQITNYLLQTYFNGQTTKMSLKSFNYYYLQNDIKFDQYFALLCKYDYFALAKLLLETTDVDLTSKEIKLKFFL